MYVVLRFKVCMLGKVMFATSSPAPHVLQWCFRRVVVGVTAADKLLLLLLRHLAGKLAALADAAADSGVFLMAATLRPETMYGQTNCWALPEGQYGAYKGLNGEVYIMTYRSALNLSYQVC
jgi:hypothetical protein